MNWIKTKTHGLLNLNCVQRLISIPEADHSEVRLWVEFVDGSRICLSGSDEGTVLAAVNFRTPKRPSHLIGPFFKYEWDGMNLVQLTSEGFWVYDDGSISEMAEYK